MKTIFKTLQQFVMPINTQAETEKPKIHYLQARLNRLQKLAQLARQDKNVVKSIQAHRLINELQKKLSINSSINLPYIN